MDFENVTLNLFDTGEVDIQTYIEGDNPEVIRINTFMSNSTSLSDISMDVFLENSTTDQYQIFI